MSDSQNLLVTMQGPVSEVDVLDNFTVNLEHSAFSIRDIYYVNRQSVLSLLVRLELADSADMAFLWKELDLAEKNIILRYRLIYFTKRLLLLLYIVKF